MLFSSSGSWYFQCFQISLNSPKFNYKRAVVVDCRGQGVIWKTKKPLNLLRMSKNYLKTNKSWFDLKNDAFHTAVVLEQRKPPWKCLKEEIYLCPLHKIFWQKHARKPVQKPDVTVLERSAVDWFKEFKDF